MWEFFRGWRRQAGCIVLVMACMLMIEWMRSRLNPGENLLEYDGVIRSHDEAIRFVYDIWSPRGLLRVEQDVVIPYFVIVLPLTLLSAYLIVWKPRKPERRYNVDTSRR